MAFDNKQEVFTHPWLTRSTHKEAQLRLGNSLHYFRLRRLGGTGSRNAVILRLINVGAAGSRIKRWDESHELTLQHKLIIPSSSALSAARLVLIVIFLLNTQLDIIKPYWQNTTQFD